MNTSLETTDIFRGAFFMCMGGDLEDVRFRNRQIASFMFKGDDLHKHDKASTELKTLVETRGIQLKKNGKGWFGLCPFHNDKNPSLSITPSKNEWHCFGCGAGGDVIRFVELFDRVDFKEAVKRLSGNDVEKIAVKRSAVKRKNSLYNH